MEHRTKGRKFSRTASHKKAMMSNLSVNLIKNDRIKTTLAKAKELRLYIEPLVTKARKANASTQSEQKVHLRRVAKSFLKDDAAVKKLFDEIGPKYADRPGGYTRVLKTGHRPGDGADTAIIEFVDFNYVQQKEESSTEVTDTKKKKKGKKDEDTTDEPKAKKETKKKETKSEAKKTKKTSKKEA
jgi:large subunit ribosomal protein L17